MLMGPGRLFRDFREIFHWLKCAFTRRNSTLARLGSPLVANRGVNLLGAFRFCQGRLFGFPSFQILAAPAVQFGAGGRTRSLRISSYERVQKEGSSRCGLLTLFGLPGDFPRNDFD